ncbi:hypothetical protein F5Y16DRAFT_396398 [Xylariaceae sp. FL0255]|nr:hypothetical protein F5Y16DRAFT_396398 [Xylariaceae sp. FL0255]
MLRKPALSALSASNGVVFECTARSIACSIQQQQQRSFVATPQRNAHITQFTKASTPALDSLLSEIRTKIILPSYLPSAQRKKIHAKRYEKALQNDPITIEIDGEVLKFRYVNPHTSMPSTSRAINSAIQQFTTPDDFKNFKPLMEGLANARRSFSPNFYPKLVRVFGDKGRIYDIIDAARSVKTTNFKLGQPEVAAEVLLFTQLKAIDADFAENETRQALRWAEMIYEMLHDESHEIKFNNLPSVPSELPLHRDPMIIMSYLHLAAQVAVRYDSESADAADKVRKLAKDVVNLWPEGKKIRDVQPAVLYERENKLDYLNVPSKFVALTAPLLAGLDAAIQVLGSEPELVGKLQKRRDVLTAEIEEMRSAIQNKDDNLARGERIYRQLYP